MPVFDLMSGWVNPANRPSWSALTAVGRFRVPTEGARFDRHHHRTDEIWIINGGKAKVFTDGAEHYVQAGDVVVTQAGDTHDFVEVYDEVTGYFVELGPPLEGEGGHLHEGPADALGHPVPAKPLPADFPGREAGAVGAVGGARQSTKTSAPRGH